MLNKTQDENQKGVALIITFFIMVVILGINLSVSAILYSEIKIVRNIGSSIVAFYAAESGVEKVLYYDRKVLFVEEGLGSKKGVCYMCQESNSSGCFEEPVGNTGEKSIYCNDCQLSAKDIGLEGCDPGVCNNCEVSFNTQIDNQKRYEITATVSPGLSSNDVFLKVDSTGYYKDHVLRAIEINFSE